MNPFHKIVWNCARRQYIVVSELARGRGKCAASHAPSARTPRRRGALMLSALGCALAVAGLLAPPAGASSCQTGTPGQSAPAGGHCAIGPYNPPGSNHGAGSAVVTDGDTVTLHGAAPIGTGYNGNTTVPASSVAVVSGTFDTSALVTGPQNVAVTGPNSATGTSMVYRVYDSGALADQSNLGTPVNQFEDVNGDEYYKASLGKVDASGGTLKVNLGAVPSAPPSSNSILMVSKQTYLTSADGTRGADSRIVWQSRNAIDMGIDPGLPTPDANGMLTVQVPVTTYAGSVAFNGITYTVTNATQLAAYNDALVAALRNGTLTSQQAYDDAFARAFTTVDTDVSYMTNTTAGDLARMPNGDRYAILAQGRHGSATLATGGQIDITRASGAVKAANGATVTNNGTLSGNIVQQVAKVESGAHFVNGASGVVSSGYLAGDAFDTVNGSTFYYTGSGIMASGAGTTVQNHGIINTAGFAYARNTSIGMGLADGARGVNHGNINVGVNPGYVSTVVGVNLSGGSYYTNAADGTIYIGRGAQYALADDTADTGGTGPTYGIRVMDTGDRAVNDGAIVIGTKAQNAVGMYSTAPVQSLLQNNGTIAINGAAGGTPFLNIGMLADDNGPAGGSVVRNAGVIDVNGVNGVGLMVNADPGIQANAESTGAINVNGGADPASGTRNFGVWVNGAGGMAKLGGALTLSGTGAIGAFAQNGGVIHVAAGSEPQFLAGTDQIGFYASGAGSAIHTDASAMAVNTERSTLFRVADGAAYTGASGGGPLHLTVSGTDARGVVATGAGTTLSTDSSVYEVTGAAGTWGGAAAIVNEGGAVGTIDATTLIRLSSAGATAGIVDGQRHDITGAAVGGPIATTLTNNAAIDADTAGVTGFAARNGGTLVNNSMVQLNGASSTGLAIGAYGTVQNNATVRVAHGDGALVQGAAASLVNNGIIQADDGHAAVHLTGPGASVAFSGAGLIQAGGTADGILIDASATGGLATGTAGRIVVSGSGRALNNQAAGGRIALVDTTVVTTGAGAAGIESSGDHGDVVVSGGAIATTGANAMGMHLGSAGTLRMAHAAIATTGAYAHGIMLDSAATAVLMGGSVAAMGAGASAVYVQGPDGAIAVNGSALDSAAGAGATANAGGTLTLADARVTGAGAGIRVTDTAASGALSSITVHGGSVGASAGHAIDVDGARADIALANGATLTAGSGVLLNIANGGVAHLDAQGVTLRGDIIADARSGGTVDLRNGTTLTGRTDPVAVDVDASSAWNVTASSDATTLANAGLVAFVAPAGDARQAGSYKTLTVANYTGNNGVVALNTYLGGDGSPSDRLVIAGGAATGATELRIRNTGGPGALTQGDGINVVTTADGGTTAPGAFRLGAPVQSGAYEYLLYRGGSADPQGYYLRSALTDPPADPSDPSPGPVPYRPGVAGYTLAPALNLDYGFASLGRLQERVGDIPPGEQRQKGNTDGVWGRIGGNGLNADSGSRFAVEQQTFFMQFGKDWTLARPAEGGSTHAGLTASLGVSSARFRDRKRDLNSTLSDDTGNATLQAQSLGGYYTKYWQDGSYWDSVIQVSHYRNKYDDTYGASGTQNGAGIALSQEVGKPFPLAGRYAIEPQAQLVYQYLKLDGFDDGVSRVSGYHSNALRGRLGVRLFAPNVGTPDGSGALTPYLTFDVLHDFIPARAVTIGGTTVRPDFGRTWAEIGGGISQHFGKGSQLYANIKVSRNLGGEERRGVFGQVGYRYSW
ncbi:autotransporter outer membrane beta-barrel domain-containing protein [Achromobacter sp. Marseille-Q4962]|uniref:autotransporter outer membrane beta-barrel domain-containing protein n=1 Tax=Achromobacter sp. Marseille-Q4962 TaxID=2942202 RepID=UPI002073E113|nr:autotransporter outer membrane beta-barrel domain-containing protein [Achromobacter sp. Marseille-Q4962]